MINVPPWVLVQASLLLFAVAIYVMYAINDGIILTPMRIDLFHRRKATPAIPISGVTILTDDDDDDL